MKERAFSEMQWSIKRTNDCNGMKLYYGFRSPDERNEWACEDEEQAEKIKAAYFLAALIFYVKWSLEWKEEWLTGKASRNKANDWSETAWLPFFNMNYKLVMKTD